MGRKPVEKPKVNITLRVDRDLNEALKEAQVNRSELFEKAAMQFLKIEPKEE